MHCLAANENNIVHGNYDLMYNLNFNVGLSDNSKK